MGYASLSIEQLLSSDTGGGCNMSDTGSAERYHGGQCALVIMKNGWKIPDNYPVKKW